MTKSEFVKKLATLAKDHLAETERYKNLQSGDIIYICDGWDNFKHEVIEVDVDNRIIKCFDHSLSKKIVEIKERSWSKELQPTVV